MTDPNPQLSLTLEEAHLLHSVLLRDHSVRQDPKVKALLLRAKALVDSITYVSEEG